MEVTELDPDEGQDDLDTYLATLTPEERAEVERLWALPLDEFLVEVEASEEVLRNDDAVSSIARAIMPKPEN